MTKEELERIKQAYNSGLKVQVWFDGHWENFDAREYSMYPEPFSENRQYRIVGSDYADIAEKRIEELEKKISVLLSCANCSENKGGYICKKEYENKCLTQKIQYIKELQEENEELEAENEANKNGAEKYAEFYFETNDKLNNAKVIIRDLLRVTYGEGWNYSLGVKAMAEQFLKEV